MKQYLVIILSFLIVHFSHGQNANFDKLELLYSQGHYSKVYKQTGKLLDNPENDYSRIPTFYRALSIFQLSENRQWAKSRPHAIADAKEMYLKLQATQEGLAVIENHLDQVVALKQDLMNRIGDLKREGRENDASELQFLVSDLFDAIPVIKEEKPIKEVKPIEEIAEFSFDSKDRDEIILFAKQQIGKPYVYAGSTPSGFDCSGFTSYVFSAYKINLPRRSVDQYDGSKKVKENNVKKGDLVFFDNGSGVNHVGLIVSEKGESPVMIHASTSQGIVITDIKSSEYWSKRLKGYGTFLE